MKRQRLFPSTGGADSPTASVSSEARRISNAAIPAFALIPMLQHSGSAARCLVRPGDRVQEGMLIGKADGARSANVHSSVPGTVVRVERTTGADGTVSAAALVEFGGEFERTGKAPAVEDWEKLSRSDLLGRIRSAGVVGLGGGLQPTHLKLAREPGRVASRLIANGLDCEPSLQGDTFLMREKSAEIVTGMLICGKILGTARMVLAIGLAQEEELLPLFHRASEHVDRAFEVVPLPSRYPLGHEDLVRAAVLAKAGDADGDRGAENGSAECVVLNVSTLFAVYEAVVRGRPMIERTVTVSGSAVRRPSVLKVRIGTRVGDLFEECGGFLEQPGKVVLGGPMRGVAVSSLDFPVTKGVSGVLAYTRAEARPGPEMPCIRCGACVEACPWELVPTRLHKLIERGEIAQALAEGLSSCTECGCCAYACPSRIPLVESLRQGKRRGAPSHHG
ncbi:MAG TPA: RnfABCDGE type electron transport complex subunit C [Spirochaetia bacterium]|nr:RnfABCDGE type electron transport complex subunit C [Spirochaetia bacterium]